MNLVGKINSIALSSGSLSTCSSLVMAIMIPRAQGGLSTPYRRIIFGLSISDIIQSLAIVLGPFLLPSDRDTSSSDEMLIFSSWAIGNVNTCDFQGFILTFGATTTCMYTLFLCLYYYCKLKRNTNDASFTNKIEKKMHCFIVLFNFAVCLSALATKTFNPLPRIGSCHLAKRPFLCKPNVPGSCQRGKYANFYHLLYFPLAVPISCLLGTLGFMFSITIHVVKRDRLFRHHAARNENHGIEEEEEEAQQESEADHVAKLLRREVTLQVVLYALASLLTYGWTVVLIILQGTGNIPPLILSTILAACFPLMGLLNIIIYTRPQVVAYRRLHSDASWPVAFWRVVKAGGENPDCVHQSLPSTTRSHMWCCRRNYCGLFFRRNEQEDDSNVRLGILRFGRLYNSRISTHSRVQNRTKEACCFSGTNLMEKRISSMDSNHVEENETRVVWKEGVTNQSTTSGSRIHDGDNLNCVRDFTFLSSQNKAAISKAFEKATQRARAMDSAVMERKYVGINSYYSKSSCDKMNSEWSYGASPGSMLSDDSLEQDMELANDDAPSTVECVDDVVLTLDGR